MAQTTYQVILSTDGKHTVIVTTDAMPMTEHALVWAKTTYQRLVKNYGLKHEQYQKNAVSNGHQVSEDEAPLCAVHNLPMARMHGKTGDFWSCHQRDESGRFCSYRPAGS